MHGIPLGKTSFQNIVSIWGEPGPNCESIYGLTDDNLSDFPAFPRSAMALKSGL